MDVLISDRDFSKVLFSEHPLEKGEFENCTFADCDFSNGNLKQFKFIDCRFITCNLTMIQTNDTSFQQTSFKGCKMLGIRFDVCKPFNLSFTFDNCDLEHCSFFKLNLRKTVFRNCGLKSVDFSECDLSEATLLRCNLDNAIFERCILEKTDFRESVNYRIDPSINRMKKARFSLEGLPGLLDKYDIVVD